MTQIYREVTLTVMTCGNCGVEFAFPETMRAEKESSGGNWYCPNGHSRVYKETDASKYRKLLEREQREAASLRENMLAAQRAQEKAEASIKKLKKRAAAGLCPCCNRTVAQLAAHMKSKHKDFRQLQGLDEKKALTA